MSSKEVDSFIGSRGENLSKCELINICIKDEKYIIDDHLTFLTLKNLDDLVCEKVKSFEYYTPCRSQFYVTISASKTTSLVVIDSIINALKAMSLNKVYFKVHEIKDKGIALKLIPEDERIRDEFVSQNKYYPEKRYVWDCLMNENDNKDTIDLGEETVSQTKQSVLRPPPIPKPKLFPIDIIQINHDSLVNGYQYFIISKEGLQFNMDNIIYTKEELQKEINKILKQPNYLFILKINKTNSYFDFIELNDLIFQQVYRQRDLFINENKVENDYFDSIINLSIKEFPLRMTLLSITDLEYLEINNR